MPEYTYSIYRPERGGRDIISQKCKILNVKYTDIDIDNIDCKIRNTVHTVYKDIL